MKRILFVSSRPIYPISGGDQIRTAQQLELLVQRYEVDVVYLTSSKDVYDFRECVPDVGNIYPFYRSKLESVIGTIKSMWNHRPLQVNYYYHSPLRKFIESSVDRYDGIFCNNIRTAEYAIGLNIKKYIDFVDAISMNYEKAKRVAKGIKKLIFEIDFRRCIKYEQKCLQEFDSCAVISDVDKNYILSCQE